MYLRRAMRLFVGWGEQLRFGENPPAHHNPPSRQCVRNVIQRVRVEKHDISYFARLQATQQISRSTAEALRWVAISSTSIGEIPACTKYWSSACSDSP